MNYIYYNHEIKYDIESKYIRANYNIYEIVENDVLDNTLDYSFNDILNQVLNQSLNQSVRSNVDSKTLNNIIDKLKKNVKKGIKEDCIICTDNMENKVMIKLDCNHSFCECCILKWIKENNNCPICRKEIN